MAPSGQATPINSSIPFSSPLFTLQILLLPEVPTSNRNIFYRRYLEIETQHTGCLETAPSVSPNHQLPTSVAHARRCSNTPKFFFLVPTDRPFPNHPPNWDNPSPFRPLDPVVPVLSFHRPRSTDPIPPISPTNHVPTPFGPEPFPLCGPALAGPRYVSTSPVVRPVSIPFRPHPRVVRHPSFGYTQS